jgi:hypothetical protein
VQIQELKDFFGMDELESILLIRKSNCAFVNYKTEASCVKAHALSNNKGFAVYYDLTKETVFKNVLLASQVRRSFDQSSSGSSPSGSSPSGSSPSGSSPSESVAASVVQSNETSAPKDVPSLDIKGLSISAPSQAPARPVHYFIMKCLTKDELAWSVANNVWTTQLHNERALNEAFTVNIFLDLFSAAH